MHIALKISARCIAQHDAVVIYKYRVVRHPMSAIFTGRITPARDKWNVKMTVVLNFETKMTGMTKQENRQ